MIRFLHTRIRVRQLETSIAFYQHLGYRLDQLKDSPQGNSLAFLKLPGNDVFLELCHSPDYTATCPEDLMHTALGVDDILEYCTSNRPASKSGPPAGVRNSLAAAPKWPSSQILTAMKSRSFNAKIVRACRENKKYF
jgi:lactoylglutathione lyase